MSNAPRPINHQALRNRVLARAGMVCEFCGDARADTVVDLQTRGWVFECRAVCEDCLTQARHVYHLAEEVPRD